MTGMFNLSFLFSFFPLAPPQPNFYDDVFPLNPAHFDAPKAYLM